MCSLGGDVLPLLPRRRAGDEPPAEADADAQRTLPDLDVLRQVLAGLRRLD
jgi:hypothetical protein